MKFISRAIKNVSRGLTKSILILTTFFLIGNFVIIGLGVSNASESAKTLARQGMRAVVAYEFDWKTFYDDMDEIEDEDEANEFHEKHYKQVSQEIVDEIFKDERIKAANALETDIVYSVDFESVPVGNEDQNEIFGVAAKDEIIDTMMPQQYSPNIMLEGNYYENMIEFEDGKYTLKEGRLYTQEDVDSLAPVVLITDVLAEHNNLKVGDTITLNNYNESDITANGWVSQEMYDFSMLELEIIGIFDNTDEIDKNSDEYDYMQPFMSPDNIMVSTAKLISTRRYEAEVLNWEQSKELYKDDEYYSNPENAPVIEDFMNVRDLILLLNDPLEVDSFVEEYSAKNLAEYYVFDANNEQFKTLSKPLDTMSLFANMIVWLVIINAIVIISLVTALTLKTREYEIGVMLSIGVSKFKIIAQFFTELAVIAVIGFTLAVASGSMMSKSIGNSLLEYQITASEVEVEDDKDFYIYEDSYFSEITLDQMIAGYEVTIGPVIIAQIYLAGLAIVLLSILIPSLMIMRFNPKRILTNTQ